MTTSTTVDQAEPKNPFQSQRAFSADAVELMRGLSAQRKQTGQGSSSPTQVLQVVRELGYCQPKQFTLPEAVEAHRFVKAMSSFQQQAEVPYPSCEDVLNVLSRIGYYQPTDEATSVTSGLPIDRRRREEDERNKQTERRSSLEPSPQEQLELSDQEHQFLDALKELRNSTDRDFASSEELLSILWSIGYRPCDEHGIPTVWLGDEERCEIQIAFTRAVEQRLGTADNTDFLTCRSVMEIASELGFVQQA